MDVLRSQVTADKREAEQMVRLLASALNPSAREFVPWWRVGGRRKELSADAPEFVMTRRSYPGAPVPAPALGFGYPAARLVDANAVPTGHWRRSRPRNYAQPAQEGTARNSYRVRRTQKPEFLRRTIFVTDIDHTVTEERLALLFGSCGNVVDCRVCGDPTTGLRFAFIELQDEEDAYAALHLDGVIIGLCPLKVSPSRTAIMPVNPTFLPQTEAEKEMCSRTVYCTNIHKNVSQWALKEFCQVYFGEVSRIRLLGDDSHTTRIAFIEFAEANGAIAALNSSGIFAAGIPIRVSPSKTPIRYRPFPPTCPAAIPVAFVVQE